MNFIKPCKHIHIYLTNIHIKTVRARGQFYKSYFPLKFLLALVYMHKVLGWAIQLILQLLITQSNTFLTQCTHIEHMLEGVLVKNIFAKMTAVRT